MEGFTLRPQEFIRNTLRTDELEETKKVLKFAKSRKKVTPDEDRSCRSCLYSREKNEDSLISYYCAHLRSQKYRELVSPGDSCPKYLGKDY